MEEKIRKKIIKKGKFYVYIYLDTRKPGKYVYGDYRFLHEPIYVGKGKGNRAHDDKHNHNSILQRKLIKIGKPIIIFICDQIVESAAFALEINLIKLIGRFKLKGPLCNMTDGGEGCSGRIISEETRAKMCKSQKGPRLNRRGVHRSEETIKKMQEAAKKRPPITEETKRKIANTLHNQKPSEESNRKRSKAMTGRIASEETTKRRLEAKRRFSEETKKKMSEAAIRRYHPEITRRTT